MEPARGTAIAILAACLLSACTTGESTPRVHVLSNASGLEASEFQKQGPHRLLGQSWNDQGTPNPPDVPSGVSARVRGTDAPHNKEPRYFIPASGRLQVVSVEQPANYNTQYFHFEGSLHQWQTLIAKEGPPGPVQRQVLYNNQLSEIPWTNAGRCFHAKLRLRHFRWGKAVMFLTSYVQGSTGGPVNNDMLVLVAQGITNDGRYAVNAHFQIRHPKLPETSWDEHHAGRVFFSIDDETAKTEQWLDTQPDDSFEPKLSRYESFLDALEITHGR